MKKILFPLLAIAAVAAAPAAYAKTTNDHESAGAWRVLADANTLACFASNQPARSGEVTIGGPYSSESQAQSAINASIQCGGYNSRS